jgi:hypothetical protein
MHLSNRGRLVARTRDRPRPELPWLGNKGRLKSIKNWHHMYQGTDLDRPRKEQTQQRARPIVQPNFTAFRNGVVLKNSDKIHANWEDYYQVQPMESVVMASQQRPQNHSNLRDGLKNDHLTRTVIKQQAQQ